VRGYQRRERLNVQEAARYARYQAFAREAEARGAAGVAVAHTADDVAETLLLHLLRGAGLDGLAAMPLARALPAAALGPADDGGPLPSALRVLRPLLTVARADTAAYCAEQRLRPVPAEPVHYRRDRLRHDLLPALQGYNPAVRRALAGAAAALAEERAALDTWAARLLEQLPRDSEQVVIPLGEWRALPTAMQKRLLARRRRRSAARARGSAGGSSPAHCGWPAGKRGGGSTCPAACGWSGSRRRCACAGAGRRLLRQRGPGTCPCQARWRSRAWGRCARSAARRRRGRSLTRRPRNVGWTRRRWPSR